MLKNNAEALISGKWPVLAELEQAKLRIKTISDESHARGVKDGRASVFRDTEQQTQLLKQMIDLKDQKIESMAKEGQSKSLDDKDKHKLVELEKEN